MKRSYPEAPVLAVSVMVRKDNKILLIKRAVPPNSGCWSLPGGRVEIGETTAEAAAREVFEESGIVVNVGQVLDIVDLISYNSKGEIEYHYAIVVFSGTYQYGEPGLSNETSDAGWFTYDELKNLKLSPHVLKVINKQEKKISV